MKIVVNHVVLRVQITPANTLKVVRVRVTTHVRT
jgi:hypothetical protein